MYLPSNKQYAICMIGKMCYICYALYVALLTNIETNSQKKPKEKNIGNLDAVLFNLTLKCQCIKNSLKFIQA